MYFKFFILNFEKKNNLKFFNLLKRLARIRLDTIRISHDTIDTLYIIYAVPPSNFWHSTTQHRKNINKKKETLHEGQRVFIRNGTILEL